MKISYLFCSITLLALPLTGWKPVDETWIINKHKGYHLIYTSLDKENIKEYEFLIENAFTSAQGFFNDSYLHSFDIYVHPDRTSLDSTWQKDWGMPEFKSECWMVASGVATKLDIISPKSWDKEACEHIYAQTEKTQRLITHEMIHVYHGQLNASPDFSNTEGIDWFVEGLATYASGQCDSTRVIEVQQAIKENKIPESLDHFWSGNLRDGLSGSVVMFIDHQYGREKLKTLLPLNKKSDLLKSLSTTEEELLKEWKDYFEKL